MLKVSTCCVIIILFGCLSARAETIYVPSDYPTIQDAIDAANSGDTIVVQSGVYVEQIVINKNKIRIRSSNGPDSTVIQGTNTVITIHGKEIVLEGLTVQGVNATAGIEVQAEGHITEISGCHFDGYYGGFGAIQVWGHIERISNSQFTGSCWTAVYVGGHVNIIEGCHFKAGNSAAINGPVTLVKENQIEGNIIGIEIVRNNTITGFVLGGDTIEFNEIGGNVHPNPGGVVQYNTIGDAIIGTAVDIVGNVCKSIEVHGSPCRIENNLVWTDGVYSRIEIFGCSGLNITGNVVEGGVSLGVGGQPTHDTTVERNYAGWVYTAASSKILITGNTLQQINLAYSENVWVYLNNILEGKATGEAFVNTHHFESINAFQYKFDGKTWNSRLGNYWGEKIALKDLNNDGIGDEPLELYCNWWCADDHFPLVQPANFYFDERPMSPIGCRAKRNKPNQVVISWANPADMDLQVVIVTRRVDRFPQGPFDGTPITVFQAPSAETRAGTLVQVIDNTLPPDVPGYYAVFVKDFSGLWNADVVYGVNAWRVQPVTSEEVSRSITVLSPNGNETWLVGSIQEIRWESQNAGNYVKIEYSTDGGSTWKTIVDSTENDGAYSWTVPNDPSDQCRIRITSTSYHLLWDISDADFNISSVVWQIKPHATSSSSIHMVAQAPSADDVWEYYFDEVNGKGHDSGWIPVPEYTDTGLEPGIEYAYRFRIRDRRTGAVSAWSEKITIKSTRFIVIDTDVAIGNPARFPANFVLPVNDPDDAIALVYTVQLLRSKYTDRQISKMLHILTTFGNNETEGASFERATWLLKDFLGLQNIPIYHGAMREGSASGWEETDASRHLVNLVEENPGSIIDIVTLGPLTNLATAIRTVVEQGKRNWARNIHRVYITAGTVEKFYGLIKLLPPGSDPTVLINLVFRLLDLLRQQSVTCEEITDFLMNFFIDHFSTKYIEWNVYYDILSAQYVFDKWQYVGGRNEALLVIPLDITTSVTIQYKDYLKIAHSDFISERPGANEFKEGVRKWIEAFLLNGCVPCQLEACFHPVDAVGVGVAFLGDSEAVLEENRFDACYEDASIRIDNQGVLHVNPFLEPNSRICKSISAGKLKENLIMKLTNGKPASISGVTSSIILSLDPNESFLVTLSEEGVKITPTTRVFIQLIEGRFAETLFKTASITLFAYNKLPSFIPDINTQFKDIVSIKYIDIAIRGLSKGIARIGVTFEPIELPLNLPPRSLKLFVWTNEGWQEMSNSYVDFDKRIVWGDVFVKDLEKCPICLGAKRSIKPLLIWHGPNPVPPEGCIFWLNLPDDAVEATLKIFDVDGALLVSIPLDPAADRYPETGRWIPQDNQGRLLGTGLYLYLVEIVHADGSVTYSPVQKMVIQR